MATERQQKLLEAEDPRYHAVGTVGTGLGMIATTENFGKKVVAFGLPSAPALFLNIAREAYIKRTSIDLTALFIAHPHPQGIWPESHKRL